MPKHELYVSAPGHGKTFACIELFREEILKSPSGIDSQSYFVLPNREHAGRIQHLLLKKDISGLFNAHIITFHELTQRLLSGLVPSRPTKTLRAHLVRMIFQDPAIEWSYFNSVKDLDGFQELVSETIQEFKSSLLSIEEFEKRAQPLLKDPVFRQKFRDFSILVKRYEAKLREMGLADEEDVIRELLPMNEERPGIKLIVMDGFYHFTRAQRSVIEYLVPRTDKMVVSLTLPPNASLRKNIFAYGEATRQFLSGQGFVQQDLSSMRNHRTQNEALRHLEENVFLDTPKIYPAATDAIQFIAADHVHDEVEMMARQIRDDHREKNVHFSDIAVILRSVEPYQKRIRAVFEDYDVPYFIHERGKMIENSALLFVYHLLSLFSQTWEASSVMPLLSATCLSLPADEKEMAELQRRLQGRPSETACDAWIEWLTAQADLKVALSRFERLIEVRQYLSDSVSASDFRQRLEKELKAIGWEASLGESDQAARRAFQDLCKQWDAYGVSPQAMPDHLRRGIESGLFSEKPSGKNRVQIYDTVMALPKEYKIVFVGGLLEKQFPKEINEDAIFKDEERRQLNAKDQILEERLPRSGGERFFFYMALTRAREQLYFSYPLKDIEGKPHMTSFFVEEVQKCFAEDALKTWTSRSWKESIAWVSPAEAEKGLARKLFTLLEPGQKVQAEVLDLAAAWRSDERFAAVVEAGRASNQAAFLDKRIPVLLEQGGSTFSATRLESYLTCAFKYHGKYTLRLKEPLENRERIEMGKVLHAALEIFFREKAALTGVRSSVLGDRESILKPLGAHLEEAFAKSSLAEEPLFRREMFREKLRQILMRFIESEAQLMTRRGFEPRYFELGFGRRPGSEVGALDFLKWDGVNIEGVIDRVDVLENKKEALIVDYKLSFKDLWKKMAKGLEVQLPIYVMAAEELLGLRVVGAELRFLQADDKDTVGMYREEAREELGLSSGKSLLARDRWDNILKSTKENIVTAVKKLKSGDIAIRSKSCEYCPYDSVCRFEKWRLIYDEVDGG